MITELTLNQISKLVRALNDVDQEAYEAYFDGDAYQVRLMSNTGNFSTDILREIELWLDDVPEIEVILIGNSVDDRPMIIFA